MKIYSKKSLMDFDFWSGAIDTVNELSAKELETIEAEFEQLYPDGMTDTEINDIFWFEQDWIAKLLGYECWEHLEADHKGEEWGEDEENDEDEE